MAAFNITSLFYNQAALQPERIAIIDDKQQISFGTLAQQVDATAQYYLSKGIKRGDRVLVFVPMSLDLYRIVLALFKLGAIAVFLDEWVNLKRLEICCNIAQCTAIIGGWKVKALSLISKALRSIPIHLGIQYHQSKSTLTLNTTEAVDTALITFTTGSTGIPKAAKRTHRFLNEQFKALNEELQLESQEIGMTSLPIVLFLNLGLGCTSVIASFNPKKKVKIDKIANNILKHNVNHLIASPYLVQQLAHYVITHNYSLPQLQKIFTGGAPVFPREARLFMQAFPQAQIQIVYGSTEAEPISSIKAPTLLEYEQFSFEAGLNVGKPAFPTRIIQYVDAPLNIENTQQLKELTLKNGTIGEIIVAGNHVLDSYFNNEEALFRNKIFIENTCWHRTGDSGFIKNGYLYLTGRCNNLIHLSQRTIAPFIVENQLQEINGVSMGTILQENKSIVLLIENHSNADKEMITQTIKTLNIPFDKILFFNKLPRDPRHHSKIDYEKCRLLLQ